MHAMVSIKEIKQSAELQNLIQETTITAIKSLLSAIISEIDSQFESRLKVSSKLRLKLKTNFGIMKI